MLVTVHGSIAVYTGQEHWELADSEAKSLANLTGDVLQHMGVVVSERSGLALEAILVLGSIYGTRTLMSVRGSPVAPPSPEPPASAIDPSKLNGQAAPAASIGAGPLVTRDDELVPPMFRTPKE